MNLYISDDRLRVGADLLGGAKAKKAGRKWTVVIPGMDDDGFEALAQQNDDVARASRDDEGNVVVETFGNLDEAIKRIARALTITLRNQWKPTPIADDSMRARAIALLRMLKQMRAEGWFDEVTHETLAVSCEAEEIVLEGVMETAYLYGLIETAILILEHEDDKEDAEMIVNCIIGWATDALDFLSADFVSLVIKDGALTWEVDPDNLRKALLE